MHATNVGGILPISIEPILGRLWVASDPVGVRNHDIRFNLEDTARSSFGSAKIVFRAAKIRRFGDSIICDHQENAAYLLRWYDDISICYFVHATNVSRIFPIPIEPILGCLRVAGDFMRIRDNDVSFDLEDATRTSFVSVEIVFRSVEIRYFADDSVIRDDQVNSMYIPRFQNHRLRFVIGDRNPVHATDVVPISPPFVESIIGRLRISCDFVRIRNNYSVLHLENTTRSGFEATEVVFRGIQMSVLVSDPIISNHEEKASDISRGNDVSVCNFVHATPVSIIFPVPIESILGGLKVSSDFVWVWKYSTLFDFENTARTRLESSKVRFGTVEIWRSVCNSVICDYQEHSTDVLRRLHSVRLIISDSNLVHAAPVGIAFPISIESIPGGLKVSSDFVRVWKYNMIFDFENTARTRLIAPEISFCAIEMGNFAYDAIVGDHNEQAGLILGLQSHIRFVIGDGDFAHAMNIGPVPPPFVEPIFRKLWIARNFMRVCNDGTILHLENATRSSLITSKVRFSGIQMSPFVCDTMAGDHEVYSRDILRR